MGKSLDGHVAEKLGFQITGYRDDIRFRWNHAEVFPAHQTQPLHLPI